MNNSSIKSLTIIFFLMLVLSLNLVGMFQWLTVHKIVCMVVLLFVLVTRLWKLLHCALLFFFISIADILLSWLGVNYYSFQFLSLAPFLLSTVIILPFPQTREALSWVKKGTVDRVSTILLGLTGILSVVALLIWAIWTDTLGIGTQLAQGITSQYPLWFILVVGIPFFALVNAFAEEVVYRGVLQEALIQVFPQMPVVLVLQTSAFAAFHFAMGFPNGWVGYGMVFVWGLMLGYLRIRTGGMLIPYITHVIADLTIGYYLCLGL